MKWWCKPRDGCKWKCLAPQEWEAGDVEFTLRETRDGPVRASVRQTDVGWWWIVVRSRPGAAVRWSTAGRDPTLAGAMRACELITEDQEKEAANAEVAG